MAFVPLTLTASMCLIFTLAVFFLREHVATRAAREAKRAVRPAVEN
jgi:hypothetical protein